MATIPISIALTLNNTEPQLKIRADKAPPSGGSRPRWKEILIQNRVLVLEVAVPINTYRFRIEGPTEIATICFSTFTIWTRNNEPCCDFSEETWILAESREFELKISHLATTTLDIEIVGASVDASSTVVATSTAKKKYKGTMIQKSPILGDSILEQG